MLPLASLTFLSSFCDPYISTKLELLSCQLKFVKKRVPFPVLLPKIGDASLGVNLLGLCAH
jgi:hypothetical protein